MTSRRDTVVTWLLVILSIVALGSLSLAAYAVTLERNASRGFTSAQVGKLRAQIDSELAARSKARDAKEKAAADAQAKKDAVLVRDLCAYLAGEPDSPRTLLLRRDFGCTAAAAPSVAAVPVPANPVPAATTRPGPSPSPHRSPSTPSPYPSPSAATSAPAPSPSPSPSPSPRPAPLVCLLGACL